MQITRPTPGILEIRNTPWALWLFGAALAAGGALLLLLAQLGWVSELRCRHDAEGEVRCTLTRSLYGLMPSVTEVRGVTGARIETSRGSRSTSYRTVLTTAGGDVPVRPYSSSGGGDTNLVARLQGFVADPSQPELTVASHDPFGLLAAVLMVIGGLAVVALTSTNTWTFSGGELTVRQARLAGTRTTTYRLDELRYAELQRTSKGSTRVTLARGGAADMALTSYYSGGEVARKQEAVAAINEVLAQRGALDRGAMERADAAREIMRQGGREMLGALLDGGGRTENVRRADGTEVAVPLFLREALAADPDSDEALSTLRALLPAEDDRRRFLNPAAQPAAPSYAPSYGLAAAPVSPLAASQAAPPAPLADTFVARLIGLVTFRGPVYRRIAEDPRALAPAAAIVAVTAAVTGFAGGLTSGATMTINGQPFSGGPELAVIQAVAVTISALIGWVVGSALCALVSRAMGGRTDTGEMLRVCGHVNLFSLLELLLPGGVVLVWLLSTVGTVIAAREAAEFSTRRAVVAAGIAWGVALVVAGVLRLALTFGALAAVGGA